MPENDTQRHNFRHLYHDVFWWGALAGSTLSFLPVFLARIEASPFQIGMLTAGPAIISLLFSLPAGRWLRGADMVRSTLIAAMLHRFGFLVILPLPWVLSGNSLVVATLIVILIAAIAGSFVSISFNAMFAELIPGAALPGVVGRRNALLAFSTTITTLACGGLLEVIPFPINYQVVFGIGVIGAGMSAYHIGKLKSAHEWNTQLNLPMRDLARIGRLFSGDGMRQSPGMRYLLREGSSRLLRLEILRTPFGPLMLAYFLFYFIQHITVPLFPIYFVETLQLSDGMISIASAVFNGSMLLASTQMGRLSRMSNPHRVLTISAVLYCVYPLLSSLAQGAPLLIIASLLGGAIWAVANAGLISLLMERVPAGDRPAHMAMHNLLLNLGILLGSFAGPWIAGYVDLRGAILIGAGLRIAAGLWLGWLSQPPAEKNGMIQSPAQ
jgi:hypothetical protein